MVAVRKVEIRSAARPRVMQQRHSMPWFNGFLAVVAYMLRDGYMWKFNVFHRSEIAQDRGSIVLPLSPSESVRSGHFDQLSVPQKGELQPLRCG